MRTVFTTLLLIGLTMLVLIFPNGARATEEPLEPVLGDDYSVEMVSQPEGQSQSIRLFSEGSVDPLGIVVKAPFMRRHTLDTDHWQVFGCGSPAVTVTTAVQTLNGYTSDYYSSWSAGSLDLVFVNGINLTPSSSDPYCLDTAAANALTNVEGVFVIDAAIGGGFASPGVVCSTGETCDWVPSTALEGNGRYVLIGANAFLNFPRISVHELGHTLHWPHSNSGGSDKYDNPMDVMSSNSGTRQALGTTVYNRYLSGWVDPADVVVYSSGYTELSLQPGTSGGTQMLVIAATVPNDLYVLGARTISLFDPISESMEGVEVYLIDHNTCAGWAGSKPCPGLWRRHITEPAIASSLSHVYGVGETFTIGDTSITITGRDGEGFILAVGEEGAPTLPFVDIGASIFVDDIVWLAGQGITSGCNPPTNDHYCPTAPVTRGQMAAFLVRALNLTDEGSATFTDDNTSVFESDIAKLATAGITSGCNPPTNDHYCPTAPVTREQMAAFLHRALGD